MIKLKLPPIPKSNSMTSMELMSKMTRNSISDLLNLAETPSGRGNVFEKLADILIKCGYLDTFPINKYRHYHGNANTCSLYPIASLSSYLKNTKVFSKNAGGSSDITLKHQNTWVFISSKLYSQQRDISDYDVQEILAMAKHHYYTYTDFQIYLLVRDKNELQRVIGASQATNDYIVKNITGIIDMTDLEKAFALFRSELRSLSTEVIGASTSTADALEVILKKCGSLKIPLQLRFHQELFVIKLMELIPLGYLYFLLAWLSRLGKTYGVGGALLAFFRIFGRLNALILTPIPTTNTQEFVDLFSTYRDFDDFNIVVVDDNTNGQLTLGANNIVIMSKQRLGNWLQMNPFGATKFDFIIFDEVHFHGTTELSENIMKRFSSEQTVHLYLTATFQKPLSKWAIASECQFYWREEDVMYCKTRNVAALIERHGAIVSSILNNDLSHADKSLAVYDKSLAVYDIIPKMHIITTMYSCYDTIVQKISGSDYGISMSTLFACNEQGTSFLHPAEVSMFLELISGSAKERMFPRTNVDNAVGVADKSIFGRIRQISAQCGSRTTLDNQNFTTQIWFLPVGIGSLIDKLSECLKRAMEHDPILKKYEILIINSKGAYQSTNLKEKIYNAETKARADGKRGLILLAGNQCSMGISLPDVDVVILLCDSKAGDLIYQKMYRCMTEAPNKKYGFVVDMNVQRVLQSVLNMAETKNLSILDKITYVVNNLINLDDDMIVAKDNSSDPIERLYQVWRADARNYLTCLFRDIERDTIVLDAEDQKLLNEYFYIETKSNSKSVIKFDTDVDQILPSGRTIIMKVVKAEIATDEANAKPEDAQAEADVKEEANLENVVKEEAKPEDVPVDEVKVDEVKPDETKPEEKAPVILVSLTKDILKYIIALACFLTINNRETDLLVLLEHIRTTPILLDSFNHQTTIWWNSTKTLDLLVRFVGRYFKKDALIYSLTVQLKMALVSLIDNPPKLLEFIESCLQPKELETKKFGEVFTKMETVNTMLDALDVYYSSLKQKSIFTEKDFKWLDPANGMGNFPIAVYMRLMQGLTDSLPDPVERKKHILENMLYMIELNPKNSHVCRQIFDPRKEFRLNVYTGDGLTSKTQELWGVSNFDVVLGNPPYNTELLSTGASPLYHKFIERYIDNCRFLTFIVPSRWFACGKGLDGFRRMMLARSDLVYIHHTDDARTIFGNKVEIKGGVNYFLKSRDHSNLCRYNGAEIQLNKYDILVSNKYYALIDKMMQFDSITKYYLGRQFGVETNDARLVKEAAPNHLKCYASKQKGFINYIAKKEITIDYKFWKVITARAAHKASSGFGNIFIGTPDEIYNKSYIAFRADSEIAAKSLLSYLQCRLPNLVLSLRKNSQDISANTCAWIPMVPLDREWTNEAVALYFGIQI